jgi:hypothetical protein
MFHPTFKRASNTRRANELLTQNVLKEEPNPLFCPSLREFTHTETLLSREQNEDDRV